MKIIFHIVLFIFINFTIAQNNNEQELLKKYSSYELIKNPKSKYGCWTYKFKLDNGKIITQENFERKTLAYKSKFTYDTINNIKYEIKLYDRNDGHKIDTVTIEQKIYNNKKELIQLLHKGESFIRYSNHDLNGFPQLEEYENHLIYDKREFKYDSKNNIIVEKIYSKYFDEINNKESDSTQIETITYEYNINNDIISLNRHFKYPVKFPIIYGGGWSHYENEKFRYEYNNSGLWTKKYWIINEREILIEKRKFYH
ncbi:hypothetical protein [Flavobacterium koreense]